MGQVTNEMVGAIALLGVILWAILLFLFVWRAYKAKVDDPAGWRPTYMEMSIIWAGGSVLWWAIASNLVSDAFSLLVASSAVGLAGGALVGFAFTSYEEESESVGKVRNWLIGGITGLTIAELATGATNFLSILDFFAGDVGSSTRSLHACNLFAYAVLGFFGSFILRELWLNVVFARARRQRREVASAISSAMDAVEVASEAWNKNIASPDDGESPSQETFIQALRVVESLQLWQLSNFDNDMTSLLVIARSHHFVGRYATAAGLFESILERFGFQQEALEGCLITYEKLGAYGQAARLVNKHLDQLGAEGLQWLAYYTLHDPEQLSNAIRYGEEYVRRISGDAWGWFN